MSEKKPARICVPVCAKSATGLMPAIERAAKVGDVVELRLDCLDASQLETAMRDLNDITRACPRPLILTFRPVEQGGNRTLAMNERASFWASESVRSAIRDVDFVDLEFDLFASSRQSKLRENLEAATLVCSYHDFVGVPVDLEKIYERMAGTSARILKIALQADEITDCLPVFRLLERAQREGRELIAIAMGNAGLVTRILGPARGAFLTYGSLDEEQKTAPGQVSAQRLRELYRVDQLDRQTMVMGLIGMPVMHSFSPQIHNAAFKALDLNAVFMPFEVRDAAAFIRRMAHPRTREMEWNLRGLSVTAPHKSAIMSQLDFVEPSAREIGAVNTVVVEGEELRGFNTDVIGFISTLKAKLSALRGRRCAVIGAGGAARAVLWGLQQEGAQVVVFARDAKRAATLAESFGATSASLANAKFDEFDAVINATPLGTRGTLEGETVATAGQLRGARLAYDLVYNPAETRFIREARAAGCETMGGLGMLVAQAAEQFRLWTGKTAPLELMSEAAAAALK